MNGKINILRAILIILLLIMFGTIFNFSNQNGEKSGSLSREVTEEVTKNINSIQKLEKSEKEKVLGKIEHYIRKLAHFSLYLIVGILTMSLMCTFDLKNVKRIFISLAIGVFYAMSDEFHQAFIPDRTASIFDVFIDSCGVFCGIILVYFCLKLYFALHKKYDMCAKKVENCKDV